MTNIIVQFVCLLILCHSCGGQSSCSQCPDGWVYFQQSCYLFGDNVNMDWTEATHFCSLHHANLVAIESDAENKFLQDFVKRLFRCHAERTATAFWTGASDSTVEGLWTWYTDDSALTYTDWAPGQPDSHRGHDEDCLILYGYYDFTWHDTQCDGKYHPLCEKRLDDAEIIG